MQVRDAGGDLPHRILRVKGGRDLGRLNRTLDDIGERAVAELEGDVEKRVELLGADPADDVGVFVALLRDVSETRNGRYGPATAPPRATPLGQSA